MSNSVGSLAWKERIMDHAQTFGIHVTPHQADQFAVYAEELLTWNRKINITTITDPIEIAIKHFVDSIIPGQLISANDSVLDIGSGGGFPGIPIKILLPSIQMTLLDASRKRVNFQRQIIRLLNLENISAHEARAEALHRHADFCGQFDVIISRAFSSLPQFLKIALPFIKNQGKILAMKGHISADECDLAILEIQKSYKNNLPTQKSLHYRIILYNLPNSDDRRSIIVFE
ncbi:MAG TPA: 16S rRNA (guanine(527)-N(7))-methyltransferase RsmG [Desulfatirhabdiaceae bacterium]|nr:16S rRNA (guanine(527)-N(7))-methyltransferase RsmG [Desulfatirhabdiaceae bacterium]